MKISNIEIPPSVIDAVRAIPKGDVVEFFEAIRRDYQGQITSVEDHDLPKLKAKTECVSRIEQLFITILAQPIRTSF